MQLNKMNQTSDNILVSFQLFHNNVNNTIASSSITLYHDNKLYSINGIPGAVWEPKNGNYLLLQISNNNANFIVVDSIRLFKNYFLNLGPLVWIDNNVDQHLENNHLVCNYLNISYNKDIPSDVEEIHLTSKLIFNREKLQNIKNDMLDRLEKEIMKKMLDKYTLFDIICITNGIQDNRLNKNNLNKDLIEIYKWRNNFRKQIDEARNIQELDKIIF